MEHNACLSTWCRPFMHTREKEVFFLNTLKISLAPTHQEGPFQVMFLRTQQQKKKKGIGPTLAYGPGCYEKMCGSAETCIQFLLSIMTMSALTWMVKNIPNRTTIEDISQRTSMKQNLSDSTISFICMMRMLCLFLALMIFLQSLALPSSSLVTMAVLTPHWVLNSDRFSPGEDRHREDYYCYEALAFSRHTINLEFDDETMASEKATEALRNARIDPSAMKMKQWYQGHDRVNDQKAPTGTDRASGQAREPIEDDDERLAMKQCDVPPPGPERVANPRVREDRATKRLPTKLATGRLNFGKLRILINQFLQVKSSTFPTIFGCHFSQNSGATIIRL